MSMNKGRYDSERGAVSLQIVLVFFFLGGLVLAAGLYFSHAVRMSMKLLDPEIIRQDALLLESVQEVVLGLSRDRSPQGDSLHDHVWSTLDRAARDDVNISLEDIASRPNLNLVQKVLLQNTGLATRFLPGKDANQLQQWREDRGIALDIVRHYEDFFPKKDLETAFTAYSWANINSTDEFVLRQLYTMRTGSETGGEGFHAKVQALLKGGKLLKRNELRSFLASDYERLFPFFNTEPSYNVNMMDEWLLEQLIANPEYKIENAKAKTVALLQLRLQREILENDIRNVIGSPNTDLRLFAYLGSVTWFWNIRAESAARWIEIKVARLPTEQGAGTVFRIVAIRRGNL